MVGQAPKIRGFPPCPTWRAVDGEVARQPLGPSARLENRSLERVSTPLPALSLHCFLEVQQGGQGDRAAAIGTDYGRNVAFLDPASQGRRADTKRASRKGLPDRRSEHLFEVEAHGGYVGIARRSTFGPSKADQILE